jgi:rod shape-determining protein MreD
MIAGGVMGGRGAPPSGGYPGGRPPGAGRVVRRALLSPLLLILAVLGQLVVVNRLPLPGGGGTPDVVLLVVAALGVSAGPVTGLLAGFAGGLAIDVAPPGGHLAGEYALIYCLVGYGCGRIRDLVQGSSADRSATASLAVMAVGVVAGEAGKAALGLMLSDPNMTGPALRHVLPAAVIYDLLLCPFVLWLVAAVVGHQVIEHAPEPQFPQAFRYAPAFRLASAGAAPGLRLAGSSPALAPPPVRSEPRLRLASGRSSSLSRTNSAFSSAGTTALGRRPVKLNFSSTGRGNQLAGASALRAARVTNFQGKSPAKGWLRPGKPTGPAGAPRRPNAPGKGWARGDLLTGLPGVVPAWRGRSPGRGWLQPVKPARPPRRKSLGKGWARGSLTAASIQQPASHVRLASPGKGWLSVSPPVVPPSWRRRAPGKGWLRPVKPASAPRLKSPGRGWLRPAKPPPAPHRKSPGRGWLRPAKPPPAPHRKSPGRGWLRTSKPPKQNWYTRSPSTRWLKRSRRRRRLLLGGRR